MVIPAFILFVCLNSPESFNETQYSWMGGPREETPVSSWGNQFYACENMGWFLSEETLKLDYAQDIAGHVVDGSAGAPCCVVQVNMDADTDTDLLISSWSDNLVLWYRNNGNGDSWTPVEIAAQLDGAVCARPLDVNNDGFMDVVATAYYEDSLYWFESDSSEYLWIRHPIAEIDRPGEIIPMRNGGQVQVLVTESASGSLYLFKASVQPDTVYWSPYQIPGNYPGISSIDILDADMDGDLDIAIAEYNNSRVTYLECITWYTEFETHVVDSAIPHPTGITMGKIDGDDYADIAVCSFDESAVYWYGNLAGSWDKQIVTDSLWGASDVCICDVTSDEDEWSNIVAAGAYDGEVRWYEQTITDEWAEYLLGELPGVTALCAAEIDTLQGLEIVGAAGFEEGIKYWSPGFLAESGDLRSSILDGQVGRVWNSILWTAELPADSTLSLQVRGSDDWENMGDWSEELYEPTELTGILPDTTRYFQYRVLMTSPDCIQTPLLDDVTVLWDDVGIEETSSATIAEQLIHITSANPVKNSLEFTVTAFQGTSTRLFDLSGRVVEEFTTPYSGTFSFQTMELAPGLYFLQTEIRDIPTYRIVILN